MKGTPQLVDGWREIAADQRESAHAQSVLNSAAKWNPEANHLLMYMREFMTLTCAPDMLAMRLFPNAKEISESFAAYDAARHRLPGWDLGDSGITVVAVGDGRTPRTAATFAMRSAWNCYSVDPNAKGGTLRWSSIQRLTILKDRIEDVVIEADRVIVAAVHSHARLENALLSIKAREVAVIAMGCCVPQLIPGLEPDVEYADRGVMSPCRTVKIWRDVNRRARRAKA